jgi:hypothetical protein
MHYVLSTRCQWRYNVFPLGSTVFGYSDLWTCHGAIGRIHHSLCDRRQAKLARYASAAAWAACVIDSQNVNIPGL